MRNPCIVLLAGCALAAAARSLSLADEAPLLRHATARRVLAAAVAEAQKQGAGGAIAIVDDGGHLVLAERLEGTFPAAARISIGKARTAAVFRKPTKVFEEIVNKGRTSMTALEDFTPLQGGHPIVVAGRVVGAIGVSGAASAAADEEIALAALKSIETAATADAKSAPAATVAHLKDDAVARAFAKGAPLVEVDAYKIHASRREGPGQAEVHRRDTDIVYVTSGTAKLVTGGEIVDGKPASGNEEEVRGASIRGGETRQIARGDVIVVPAGVPHWFQEVKEPITYYVVKVTNQDGGCCR